MQKILVRLYGFVAITALFGCGLVNDGVNYTDLQTPRYGSVRNELTDRAQNTVKVVSYNIKFSKRANLAAELLNGDVNLREADIIFLQEMDREGVELIANKINCSYVYYPAVRHPLSNRDFGNAILTKWPIISDQKIILPHLDPDDLQRVVVGARIQMGNKRIWAYSIHMSIWLHPYQRQEQLATLFSHMPPDADAYVIGGDFNTFTRFNQKTVFDAIQQGGFELATAPVKWTYKHWYLLNKKSLVDYIFVKNMEAIDAGIVKNRRPSDHVPIWASLKFRGFESAKE